MKCYGFPKIQHANVVYRKCINANKLKLAMNIGFKYGLQDETKNDDTVMSLRLAIMSMNNQ